MKNRNVDKQKIPVQDQLSAQNKPGPPPFILAESPEKIWYYLDHDEFRSMRGPMTRAALLNYILRLGDPGGFHVEVWNSVWGKSVARMQAKQVPELTTQTMWYYGSEKEMGPITRTALLNHLGGLGQLGLDWRKVNVWHPSWNDWGSSTPKPAEEFTELERAMPK